jgi:glycosyltransferase involved in cell wall biosynthesis
MTSPSLAICIPAFNAIEFLPRLLESVHGQTVPFDEIWIYDDCSTDNTADMAAQLGARVVTGDVNRGCAVGRNALAAETKCEWLHFHDADDALYPTFVEQALRWMTKSNSPDVVLFGYDWIDEGTGTKLDTRFYNNEPLQSDPIAYAIQTQIQSICGIYKREAFLTAGGYNIDPEVLYNEDVAMHCRLAIAGLSFAADQAVTVINYRRSESMSQANQIKCIRAHYAVLRNSAALVDEKYYEILASKLWAAAGVAGTFRDWETADQAAALAVELNGRTPNEGSFLFKTLCALNPRVALRAREAGIRLLKPELRRSLKSQVLVKKDSVYAS